MGGCCNADPRKLYRLNVGGEMISLIGLEEAFSDLKDLDLKGNEAGMKILELLGRVNYIPECAELEYKTAVLKEYKNYLAEQQNGRKS